MRALATGLVVWFCLGAAGSGAEQARPSGLQLDVRDAALLRAVRGIAGQVEELRGERFASPVEAVRIPPEMLDVAAALRAFAVVDRERLAARGRAWSDLGFGSPGAPEALYTLLAQDLRGVGFDVAGNRLLVSPERLTERDFEPQAPDSPAAALLLAGVRPDAPLVAHVLMHVRQRERSGHDLLAETTDETLARAAWGEGEANLVAVRYLFSGLSVGNDAIAAGLDPGQYLDGGLVSAAVGDVTGVEVDLLRFVYQEGYAQAVERSANGGWSRVGADLERERTTRQVLHPGAASARTDWTEPLPPFEGLRLADRDSLGEQGVIVFVSRLTGKDNLALQAGEGWAGDRLLRWESAGDSVTEWVTRWASADDVEDFDYALTRVLAVRFPDRAPRSAGDNARVLDAGERVLRIERGEGEVRLLVATAKLGRGWIPAIPGS